MSAMKNKIGDVKESGQKVRAFLAFSYEKIIQVILHVFKCYVRPLLELPTCYFILYEIDLCLT